MTHSPKYFEDFAAGDKLPLGEKTVSRGELLDFARSFDPSAPHIDEVVVSDAVWVQRDPDTLVPLDGVVASNWHVGSMFMRTFFDGLLDGAWSRGSPGIESLNWPNPVRPGDVIAFSLEIAETKTSRSRPELGFVLFDIFGVNQRGEPVAVARCWTMFGRRDVGEADVAVRGEKRAEAVKPEVASRTPAAGSPSLWFDDIAIGNAADLGTYHFDSEGIVRFARAFDPQPFHLSEEAGKASIFGGLAASGWQTAAAWQSLMSAYETAERATAASANEAVPPYAPTLEVSDLRWLRPVLAGDTITYRTTVRDKHPATMPEWGVVTSLAEGFNQRGDLVFHLTARRFAKLKT